MAAPQVRAKRGRTLTPGALLLIPLCLVCGSGCGGDPPAEVEVTSARRGLLVVHVTTNGKVEPRDEADVHARLHGRVLEIPEPGAAVEEGDIVVRIDAAPVAAAIAEARSDLLEVKDSLRSARKDMDRLERRLIVDTDLHAKGAVTSARLAETEAEFVAVRARVSHLERSVPLTTAALDLRIEGLTAQSEGAVIRSPFPGTVYRREVKAGQMVQTGDPILRIARLDQLRVRANVDQVDLGRVQVAIVSASLPTHTRIGAGQPSSPRLFRASC